LPEDEAVSGANSAADVEQTPEAIVANVIAVVATVNVGVAVIGLSPSRMDAGIIPVIVSVPVML